MLRFHKFTIGSYWTSDYGCSENKDEFEYMMKYLLFLIYYCNAFISKSNYLKGIVHCTQFKKIKNIRMFY